MDHDIKNVSTSSNLTKILQLTQTSYLQQSTGTSTAIDKGLPNGLQITACSSCAGVPLCFILKNN